METKLTLGGLAIVSFYSIEVLLLEAPAKVNGGAS